MGAGGRRFESCHLDSLETTKPFEKSEGFYLVVTLLSLVKKSQISEKEDTEMEDTLSVVTLNGIHLTPQNLFKKYY